MVSLLSLDWSGILYIDKAVLELTEIHSSVSASLVLGFSLYPNSCLNFGIFLSLYFYIHPYFYSASRLSKVWTI